MQLLTVVVRSGFFDLYTNLLHAALDSSRLTSAIDDGGILFRDFDTLGLAQVVQRDFFERHADFFGDDLATGQDRDVFQHCLATIAKARRLHCAGLQDATDVVNHQRCQCFAFDIFSNDQQRTASFGDLLEHRQQITDVRDLFVAQQDEWAIEQRNLLVWVVDEVRREIAAVELHTFDDIQLVVERLAVFNGDHTFFADFFHRLSDTLTDRRIRVSRDRADLRDFFRRRAGLGNFLQLFNSCGDCFIDAALQVHRVHAGGNVFHALAYDSLGQYGRGSGAVTSIVGRFGCDFFHHLRAHVHQLVFQLDLFSNRNPVFGDGGCAE